MNETDIFLQQIDGIQVKKKQKVEATFEVKSPGIRNVVIYKIVNVVNSLTVQTFYFALIFFSFFPLVGKKLNLHSHKKINWNFN